MTTNELMAVRYKVIADYPKCPFEIGQILMQDMDTVGEVFVLISEVGERFNSNWIANQEVCNYPHLFKKLEWWEHREESDMPQYVKSLINQKYYKVTSFYTFSFKGICNVPGELGIDYPWDNALPATEQDYLNQNKA